MIGFGGNALRYIVNWKKCVRTFTHSTNYKRGRTLLHLYRDMLRFARLLSTKSTKNLFQLFPKTCPSQPPVFTVDKRSLRKEFRTLQQQLHPDSNVETVNYDDAQSSLLNKAYNTLKSPLLRAQHLLELQAGIDLSADGVSQEYSSQDKTLLFEILEIHEQLESAESEEEIESLKMENNKRIMENEELLNDLFQKHEYQQAALETIKLKYWTNIDNAIKNWEPGKPVNLTH